MAKVNKNKLPEVHIDIGSHNYGDNPAKRVPKTGQLDARFTVTKMGMDSNGNHSVWVSFRGGRAKKIQTNQNLPLTHRDRGLTPRAVDEILDFVDERYMNPAPRIGTAKPRRRSQITGKAPSKRLVTRRKANTRKGYFPNPIGEGKLAVWLNAGNNTNGNPRRLFVVVDTRGQILSVHDEDYYGQSAVTQHYPGIGIVGQFSITPAQYRELRKKEK